MKTPVLFIYEYSDIIYFLIVHFITYLIGQTIVRRHKRFLSQRNLERTFLLHMFFYSIVSLSLLTPILFFSKYPIETIIMSFLTHIIVFLLIVYLYVANMKWIIHLFAPIDKLQNMSSTLLDSSVNESSDEDTINETQLFWEEMLINDNEDDEEDEDNKNNENDGGKGKNREKKITKDAFLALFKKKDKDNDKDEDEDKNMHTFDIPHNKTLYGYLVDACLFYPIVYTMTNTFYFLVGLSFRESIQNMTYR